MAGFNSKKFFRSQIFVPFGRFRIFGDQTIKDAIALIGREDQRAFLIDALSGSGDRGAYLVTGRRGVGKTTFVENCLSEYEANVFRHFLRSSVGKNMPDQILMLLFLFAIVAFGLLAADFLEFLVPQTDKQPLLYLILIPTLLVTLFPFFLAIRTIKGVLQTFFQNFSGVAAFIVAIGIVLANLMVLDFLPFGSPALGVTYLLFGLAVLMVFGTLVGQMRWRPARYRHRLSTSVVVLICVLGSMIFLSINMNHANFVSGDFQQTASEAEQVKPTITSEILHSVEIFLNSLNIKTLVSSSGAGFSSLLSKISIVIFIINVIYIANGHIRLKSSNKNKILLFILYLSLSLLSILLISHLNPDISSENSTLGTPKQNSISIFIISLGLGLSIFFSRFLVFLSHSLSSDLSIAKKSLGTRKNTTRLAIGYLIVPALIYVVLFLTTYYSTNLVQIELVVTSLQICYAASVVLAIGAPNLFRIPRFIKPLRLAYQIHSSSLKMLEATLHKDRKQHSAILKPRFVPPVEALSLYKAICLIILSLQLTYPMVGLTPDAIEVTKAPSPISTSKGLVPAKPLSACSIEQTVAYDTNCKLLSTAKAKSAQATQSESQKKGAYFTLFPQGHLDELVWPFLVVALIGSFFAFEYEWINKSFIAQRQSNTLDKASRDDKSVHSDLDPNWLMEHKKTLTNLREDIFIQFIHQLHHDPKIQNSSSLFGDNYPFDRSKMTTFIDENAVRMSSNTRKLADNYVKIDNKIQKLEGRIQIAQKRSILQFRAMESTTFPYMLARFFLPVIFVRVNLGFDSLDHRGVTQAMLFGLQKEYQKRFVALRSPYGIINSGMVFIIAMMLMSAFSEKFIDFPQSSTSAESGRNLSNYLVMRESEPLNPYGHLFRIIETSLSRNQQWKEQGLAKVQGLDYCAWLSTIQYGVPGSSSQKSSALFPSALCSLSPDFANGLFPFIYAPILTIEDNIGVSEDSSIRLIYKVAHRNNGLPVLERNDQTLALAQSPSLSFRTYHIVLLILLMWMLSSFLKRFPLIPYSRILQRIRDLSTALDHQRIDKKRQGTFSPMNWVRVAFDREQEVQTARDPMDPRSVELAFMALLSEVRASKTSLNFLPKISISLPTPEIHFIFDELDKIGGVVGADYTAHDVSKEEKIAMDAERQRAYALHALFSDMKRVISSAPAHFIFVGGRMLHDEWVRDLNRIGTRQPLLTGIFDAEIYLPSLMLDHPKSTWSAVSLTVDEKDGKELGKADLSKRIKEFLICAHQSAVELNNDFVLTRKGSFFALKGYDHDKISFEDVKYGTDVNYDKFHVIEESTHWNLAQSQSCPIKNHEEFLKDKERLEAFLDSFVGFLAYRSAGAPKKMREILSGFVRTSGSLVSPGSSSRHTLLRDRDSLAFDADEQYRIEFINFIFRHIETRFGDVLVKRDDKVTVNIIFLFDFLMKFHGRAFSWSSLERLDELAHIHRAPDLRRIFDSVINESSGLFFHRLLNGLFSFRFRSELVMEIRYLSRISEAEMAALNFTLDESQELKSTYGTMLNAAGETNSDIIAALGELYEYDQAYEVARGYYERALKMCDEDFARQMGQSLAIQDPILQSLHQAFDQTSKSSPVSPAQDMPSLQVAADYGPTEPFIKAILSRDNLAVQSVSYFMPWATRRLRLMLHIGLTFEQSGNEERALSQYHAAQMLARAITDAAFQEVETADGKNGLEGKTEEHQTWLRQILKHLNLIFQPMFASAWVGEKLENGIDTSTSMVELELALLRRLMPFLKDIKMVAHDANLSQLVDENRKLRKRAGNADSNFALVGAELHNKAGDLYFFKGRLPMPSDPSALAQALDARRAAAYGIEFIASYKDSKNEGLDGYLLKAHYHFSVSMHEMRRFAVYRRELSKFKLNPAKDPYIHKIRDKWGTFRRNYWPTFLNQAAHNSLVDLAETALARSSVLEVWRDLGGTHRYMGDNYNNALQRARCFYLDYSFMDLQSAFQTELERWFESDDDDCGTKSGTELPYDLQFARNWQSGIGTISPEEKIRYLLRNFLGDWNADLNLKDAHFNLLKFGSQDTAIEHIFMGLLCANQGAAYARHAGLLEEAAAEFVYSALHAIEHLKSFVRHNLLRTDDKFGGMISSPSVDHYRFASRLIEAAVASFEQNAELADMIDSRGLEEKDYRIGKSIMVHVASLACVLDLLISQITEQLREENFSDTNRQSECEYQILTSHFRLRELTDPWFGGVGTDKDLTILSFDLFPPADLDLLNPNLKTDLLNELADIRTHIKNLRKKENKLKQPNAQQQSANMTPSSHSSSSGSISQDDIEDQKNTIKTKLSKALEHSRTRTRARLIYMTKRHHFPMFSKLHNMKAVIDDVLLRDCKLDPSGSFTLHQESRLCEALDWIEELELSEKQYNAPMHFTPFMMADTLSLAYFVQTYNGQDAAKAKLDKGLSAYDSEFPKLYKLKSNGAHYHRDSDKLEERLARKAEDYCRKAIGSFSQGQDYYNNISRLYYLYDDFNDRLRHVNHAVQMTHADMLAIYRHLLKKDDRLH